MRNVALEQAVLDDPVALAPRSVYADWLQSEGVALGEWVALQAAIHERPDEPALRVAALVYLQANTAALLGSASEILDGLYLGWHGGFLDEIRIYGSRAMNRKAPGDRYLAELLALPAARFVRRIALGELTKGELPAGNDALLAAITRAAPPLLDTVVFDTYGSTREFTATSLDAFFGGLPRLRRLGLAELPFDEMDWSRLPSSLVELAIIGSVPTEALGRADLKNLAELTWIDPNDSSAELWLGALPALRRLRLIGAQGQLPWLLGMFEFAGVLEQLELLDVSHGIVRSSRKTLDRLRSKNCKVVAMYADGGGDGAFDELAGILDGTQPEPWVRRRLEEDGRDALAATPQIGLGLYNASCHTNNRNDFETALRLANASVTLPDRIFGPSAWGNVGYALEMLRRHVEGELAAREGLLRHPNNPNFYSILIASLRGQRRLPEARALIAKAMASITLKARREEAQVCLLDVILTLDQCGEHRRALDAVKKKPKLELEGPIHAAIALAHVGLGELDHAKRELAKADAMATDHHHGIAHHARAALHAAKGRTAQGVAALAKARACDYADAWYLDEDPRLASLRGLPTPRPRKPKSKPKKKSAR